MSSTRNKNTLMNYNAEEKKNDRISNYKFNINSQYGKSTHFLGRFKLPDSTQPTRNINPDHFSHNPFIALCYVLLCIIPSQSNCFSGSCCFVLHTINEKMHIYICEMIFAFTLCSKYRVFQYILWNILMIEMIFHCLKNESYLTNNICHTSDLSCVI